MEVSHKIIGGYDCVKGAISGKKGRGVTINRHRKRIRAPGCIPGTDLCNLHPPARQSTPALMNVLCDLISFGSKHGLGFNS
ncbi:hypothetical protein HW555_004552 [Spodoptera exigua]|uniref:Uncharacterized protein n=1 Tax=Spodoptera exigua TaxID=7107 RepID=A0A835GIX0_SPOEX|nr:hypothetical protein HW555_004552 [Spodoptera exigua]